MANREPTQPDRMTLAAGVVGMMVVAGATGLGAGCVPYTRDRYLWPLSCFGLMVLIPLGLFFLFIHYAGVWGRNRQQAEHVAFLWLGLAWVSVALLVGSVALMLDLGTYDWLLVGQLAGSSLVTVWLAISFTRWAMMLRKILPASPMRLRFSIRAVFLWLLLTAVALAAGVSVHRNFLPRPQRGTESGTIAPGTGS